MDSDIEPSVSPNTSIANESHLTAKKQETSQQSDMDTTSAEAVAFLNPLLILEGLSLEEVIQLLTNSP